MAITRNLIDHNTITIHIPGIFSAFKVVSATIICTPPQGGGVAGGGGGGLYMTNVPHDQYLRGTTKGTKTWPCLEQSIFNENNNYCATLPCLGQIKPLFTTDSLQILYPVQRHVPV